MRLWAHANSNRAVAKKANWGLAMQGALRRDAPKYRPRAGPAPPKRNPTLAAYESILEDRRNERDRETRQQSGIASAAAEIVGSQVGVLPFEDRDEFEGRVIDLVGFRTYG
jgi:hypothetical protein